MFKAYEWYLNMWFVCCMHRTCEYLMERFGSSAVFLARDAALSCYACGKTSGIVVDCGYIIRITWPESITRLTYI